MQRCFGLPADEPVIAHVRWGRWGIRAQERLLVTPSVLAWWRRSHDPSILPWCEPTVADDYFALMTRLPGTPFAVQGFHEAIQLLEPGEPLCDELEASILADPENPELRAIYLDWLGEFGHPRTHLNGLHPSDNGLREVLRRHKWDLGPFWPVEGLLTEFLGGFVDSIELRNNHVYLFRLLRHPSMRLLRRLYVLAPLGLAGLYQGWVDQMRPRLALLQDVTIEEVELRPRPWAPSAR